MGYIKFSFKLTGKFSFCTLWFMLDHGRTHVYFDGWLCLHWRRKPTTARTSVKTHEALKVGTDLVFTVTAPHPQTGKGHAEQLSIKGQGRSSGLVDLHRVLGSIHSTGRKYHWRGTHIPKPGFLSIKSEISKAISPLVLNAIMKQSKARDVSAFIRYNRGWWEKFWARS